MHVTRSISHQVPSKPPLLPCHVRRRIHACHMRRRMHDVNFTSGADYAHSPSHSIRRDTPRGWHLKDPPLPRSLSLSPSLAPGVLIYAPAPSKERTLNPKP